MSAIVLFDGVCNFCNSTVNFIIEHDRTGHFKFAPLQSVRGEQIAQEHGLASGSDTSPDSVILVENGRVYTHSTAIVEIAKHLESPWSQLKWLRLIPAAVRDLGYTLFAKYRYRLFGKRDQCMIPSSEIRARFLG